jgi:TorA maturation chaperone TorD
MTPETYMSLGALLLEPAPGEEADYTRLFLSPQGAACPPWQSVESPAPGDTPRLLGQSHHSALAWYRRYGFEPSNESEPADHAGLLLLFYGRLLEAGQAGVAQAFREQHLGWLSGFGKKLEEAARSEAYQEAGRLLAAEF